MTLGSRKLTKGNVITLHFRKVSLFILLIVSILIFIATVRPTPALASSVNWKRISDGRIEMQLHDISIFLTTSEFDLNEVKFYFSKPVAEKISPGTVAPSLRDILSYSGSLSDLLKDEKEFSLMVKPAYPYQHVLAQGKFETALLATEMGASGNSSSVIQFFPAIPKPKPGECANEKKIAIKNGSIFYKMTDFRNHTSYYCIPKALRLFPTSREWRVACNTISDICSASLYGRHVAIGYSFSKKHFPCSTWTNLDRNMVDYFDYILPHEDLE